MSSNSSSIILQNIQYYPNTFNLEYVAQNYDQICNDIRYRIRQLMFKCINAPILAQGGLYSGSLGIVYAALKLYTSDSTLDIFNNNDRFRIISYCDDTLKIIDERLHSLKRYEKYTFLFGKAGFYFVSILFYKITDNKIMLNLYLSDFADMLMSCIKYTVEYDLLYGFAGLLSMMLELNRNGLEFPDQDYYYVIIFQTLFIDGKQQAIRYNRMTQSNLSLVYLYSRYYYIGAAHGLSGIIQTMLRCSPLLDDDELTVIHNAVDDILAFQTGEGNFRVNVNSSDEDTNLVRWCHGAPGVIYMLAQAYWTFFNPEYLDSCVVAAEFIWKYGLLKAGPGLCHGISGNGYAFLLMYRLTGDQRYQYMALAFAIFMGGSIFMEYSRFTPDFPYSLFEGMAGELCFLCDVLNPLTSRFPIFDL